MNKFIGALTLAGVGVYLWSKNPQATPLILGLLTIGGVVLGILVFLALVCCGFQMLRLFFKI
ncbi:MAG: hypothetical protein IJS01_14000 [Lentisphaeria bacterium]|nr:hypothetical protein [Lentisphaeria bacterium]